MHVIQKDKGTIFLGGDNDDLVFCQPLTLASAAHFRKYQGHSLAFADGHRTWSLYPRTLRWCLFA